MDSELVMQISATPLRPRAFDVNVQEQAIRGHSREIRSNFQLNTNTGRTFFLSQGNELSDRLPTMNYRSALRFDNLFMEKKMKRAARYACRQIIYVMLSRDNLKFSL